MLFGVLRKIPLGSRAILYAGLSRARRRTRNWLVLLPESGAGLLRGTRAELEELVGAELAKSFHFLVINKRGLSPKGKNAQEFEAAFRRRSRISDAVNAMSRVIPAGDKIFLVGYSEGAYLAPQVAARDRRVEQIVMIGGGTRGWLKEEIRNARGHERREVRRKVREIERHPAARTQWNGFSYATWNSYRGDDTYNSLRTLKVPVHALLGAKDRVIDLKAALRDLRQLKRKSNQPIDVRTFKNCGHSFAGHWDQVRKVLEEALVAATLG